MGISTLTINEVRQVARKMQRSGLSGIEIRCGDCHVHLTYVPPSLPIVCTCAEPVDDEVTPPALAVRSIMPGHVLLQHPLDSSPYINAGMRVEKGELLALIKVGVIYLPLRSPAAGIVASLCVAQGDRVEYDSEILTLQPAL